MNIYAAFSLFSVIVLLYWVISELFTILFRFTGLPEEKARFQVTSLLTGCGYTTRESEIFLSSRSRRRLVRVTMLFGYVFDITIVTALINVFLSLKQTQIGHFVLGLLFPLSAAAIIFSFMRIPVVRSWGDSKLQHLADTILHRGTENTVLLLDYIGQGTIAQVTVKTVPERFIDIPLSQTGLKSEDNILVMLVERPGKPAAPATADTLFQSGDKLTVFGDYASICRVFGAREDFTQD